MAKYKFVDRSQTILLPTCIDNLVEDGHLAKNIWNILGTLDLSSFDLDYKNNETGAPAYNPKNMFAIILYAYFIGIRSSRWIEELLCSAFSFMFVADMQKPDHTTISRFKVKHKVAMKSIFTQTVTMGIRCGLIDFNIISTDSTKLDGAGSKKQIVEGDRIENLIKTIETYIDKLLDEGIKADEEDNKSVGMKIRQAKKRLLTLEEAKNEYEAIKPQLSKKEKVRYHLTEPEARLMKDKDVYHSGYSAQTSIDSKTQMVIDYRVTQSASDNKEGIITRENLKSTYNEQLKNPKLLFDNGYHNLDLIKLDGQDDIEILVSQGREGKQIRNNLKELIFYYNREKDVFNCLANKELTFKREKTLEKRIVSEYIINGCTNCEYNDRCFKKKVKNKRQKSILVDKKMLANREIFEAYQEKMKSPKAIETYRLRKVISELPFAHITSHRKFSRFSVWGLVKSETEYGIAMIVHNISKLLKYGNLSFS